MDQQNPNPDPVKLEIIESASEIIAPKPMEGLHDQAPPPFLTKTYDVVDDASTDQIVSWSQTNNSFVVWDPHAFSMILLPKYFKHNNFSSFVRQLNTYGFRKVDPDKWEFANEGFLRGQKHLLKTIKRRRPPSHVPPPPPPLSQAPSPFLEVGQYGFDTEIDRLKRDKNTLMAELVKLRQDQQNTRAQLRTMEQRLQGTEQRQQQMLAFLARAMRNPNFLQQLVQQREKKKELKEALSNKRQRPIDQFAHSDAGTSEQQQQYFFTAPELEDLAMEMQGFRTDELNEQQEEVDVELNDEFWQELLNDGICEEKGKTEVDEGGNEDFEFYLN